MAFSFWGGIHPNDQKRYTRDLAVQQFPQPDVLVVSMSQHIRLRKLLNSQVTGVPLLVIGMDAAPKRKCHNRVTSL